MTKAKEWSIDFAEKWKNYPEPARPTRGELEIIGRYLEKKKRPKVLILGSTIEYRLLCHKLKCDTAVIDYSRINYGILSKQTKVKLNEKFIERNWLEMGFRGEFDFILGDYAVGVVSRGDIGVFLRKLRQAVKKDGIIILKTHVRDSVRGPDPCMLIKHYMRKHPKENIVSHTITRLYNAFCDPGSGQLDLSLVHRFAEEQYRKGKIRKKDIEVFRGLYMEHAKLKLFIPEKRAFGAMLRKLFRKVRVRYGRESYCRKYLPLYILRK